MTGISVSVPKVLILRHSFVRRLRDDLDAQFDNRASKNFHLPESANVSLYGTSGRTVAKLLRPDICSKFSSRYYITGDWDKRFVPLCS